MKHSKNGKDIIKQVEGIMSKILPNQINAYSEKDFFGALTDFRYPGDESNIYRLAVDIDNNCEFLQVKISRNPPIPPPKEDLVYEFLNLFNSRTAPGHFYLHPETKRLLQVGGILLKKKFFRPEEFERFIRVFLGNGKLFYMGLNEVTQGGGGPLEIFQKIFGKVDTNCSH